MRVRFGAIGGVNLEKVTNWHCGKYTDVDYIWMFLDKQEFKIQINKDSTDKEKIEFEWLLRKLKEMFPTPEEVDKRAANAKVVSDTVDLVRKWKHDTETHGKGDC